MYKRIEIDDDLMRRAMQTTGLATDHAVITLALEKLAGSHPDALTLTSDPPRRTLQTEQPRAQAHTDLEDLLSRLHRYSDFSLFAAQLGLSDA